MPTTDSLQQFAEGVNQFLERASQTLAPHMPKIIAFAKLPESEQRRLIAEHYLRLMAEENDQLREANTEIYFENFDLRAEIGLLRCN